MLPILFIQQHSKQEGRSLNSTPLPYSFTQVSAHVEKPSVAPTDSEWIFMNLLDDKNKTPVKIQGETIFHYLQSSTA